MFCDEPGCNGIHRHVRPRAEWCPRALEHDREYRRRWGNSIAGQTSLALAHVRYEANRRGTR